ncbi:MAG: phosphoenolpyruvate--protein phosphotransferase [bacterium]|nr:phosphoenolpyruvate--protein phosphotransferase [bacterium]
MSQSIGAPRVLLRSLREIMASKESAQARLNLIVSQIAANMVAEVSSIYLRRPDGSLVLYATKGLREAAVHKTRLARGEGLVGLIADKAKPLALSDAASHSVFSHQPDTGEDPFHAFLGVPILRNGHMLGVLTLQNATKRNYMEEEVEALQTVAMVLAEFFSSDDMSELVEARSERVRSGPDQLVGVALYPSIAMGQVILHEPRVAVTRLIADEPFMEMTNLEGALDSLRTGIDEMLSRGDVARAGEHRDVLETYRMFAHDQMWVNKLHEGIETGLTVEASVERTQNEMRAQMMRSRDPFFRERLHDLDDLSNRLQRILAGLSITSVGEQLKQNSVLVARTMGPAELLDYDREHLVALVLEDAGVSAHVTIIARALGLATVGGATGIIDKIQPGNRIAVNGLTGKVHMRPSDKITGIYRQKIKDQARQSEVYQGLRTRPAITLDGREVALGMNAGLEIDLPHLDQSGATSIGLYRTELHFMISEHLPRLKELQASYANVLQTAGSRPVTFRTLDIGGDKILPYLRHAYEENPALGWRAIRFALDRPAIFRTQVRALLQASGGQNLNILLPMIADIWEIEQARELINREIAHHQKFEREMPVQIKVGTMIEVPALLWQLEPLMKRVDFVSVGTNDLLQFLFAVDRSNMNVAHRFDPLSLAFLNALAGIQKIAEKHEMPVNICGEMASRPLEAMALVGLGFNSLSMAPMTIGPVKSMLLGLDAKEIRHFVAQLLGDNVLNIRTALVRYAQQRHIDIAGI